MENSRIEAIVLDALRAANKGRSPEEQLAVSPDAPLFGPGSRLDSMGLVVLLIDIEESLHGEGLDVTLSDEKALSRTRSPFRSVPAIVAYIASLAAAGT
jgi:acyl carrier protein